MPNIRMINVLWLLELVSRRQSFLKLKNIEMNRQQLPVCKVSVFGGTFGIRTVFRFKQSVNGYKKCQIQNGSTHKKWKLVLVKFFPGLFTLRALIFLKDQHESAKHPVLVDEDEIIKEADKLYMSHQYREIYKVLYPYSSSDSDEILWRLARATFEVGRTSDSEKDVIVWLEEAYGYVQKALSLNERNGYAHKWCAILTDYVMRYRSTKDRISKSVDVRYHFERALELTPTDATVHFLLGQWCYTFADLTWYQRKLAAIVFATPPTSTYEEKFSFCQALEHFENAERLDPDFYSMNLLMLGKTYLKLNNKEKAVQFLKRAKEYPQRTMDDEKAVKEASSLLQNLGATI
ncbi:regulator of microtubule dynamics protein 1-like isoform X3 [Tachypleus tridentatus]|uniref:regulator of microtubule dynamics protein 1-like isoform X3 n=1 Tax=Tachypleus tridentatus TaxID=6853 RepID=UPI003FD69A59